MTGTIGGIQEETTRTFYIAWGLALIGPWLDFVFGKPYLSIEIAGLGMFFLLRGHLPTLFSTSRKLKELSIIFLIFTTLVIGSRFDWWHHSKVIPTHSQETESTAKATTQLIDSATAKTFQAHSTAAPKATKKKSHHPRTGPNPPSDHQKLSVGTESVVMGRVPDETKVGDRSVVLGATDANGNAIYNQPGAYGYDAHAGPGGIAIGAHAGAVMPQPAAQTQPGTAAPPQ